MKNEIKITALLLIIILVSCCQTNSQKEANYPPVTISSGVVSRMDIYDTIEIYGNIQLRQEALIASQFSGRLKEFNLVKGDWVSNGQLIGIIVPPMREALEQAVTQMTADQKQLLGQQVKEIPLYSPINGIILDVMQNNGDVVDQGESIIHIANLDKLDIYGDLPVSYIPQVKMSKSLRVCFVEYPHAPIDIKVSAIDGKVDQQNQTIPIRLTLNNPDHQFRPGMMVRIVFPDKIHKGSLVIPRESLLEEEGIYSVFTANMGIVTKQTIEIGIMHDDYVEVISGLAEGDTVAIEKAYSLTDGMKINIR